MSTTGEIQQPISLGGCEADVVVLFNDADINKEQLATELPAFVDFKRGFRDNKVYLEGSFDSESLMAIYLALNEN